MCLAFNSAGKIWTVDYDVFGGLRGWFHILHKVVILQ